MSDRAPEQDRIIVITDLDGTLLDGRTYSFDAARDALDLLRARSIPLVFCSSKTRVELEVHRLRLGNRDPFISENGGGIFVPRQYFPFPLDATTSNGYEVISLGTAYREIRQRFVNIRDALNVSARGFGDMTPPEVAALTGLSVDEAVAAMLREYTEPFVFPGTPDERLLLTIEASGLRWTQGRLFHIMGNHHKGMAVRLLTSLYERVGGGVTTIGLGDSLNDLPFLLAVDRPVLIRREDRTYDNRVQVPGIYRTIGIGPAGWNEAVLNFLSVFEDGAA